MKSSHHQDPKTFLWSVLKECESAGQFVLLPNYNSRCPQLGHLTMTSCDTVSLVFVTPLHIHQAVKFLKHR